MNVNEPKRSKEIKYINPEVPKVALPAYDGQSYEAMVPDTLDIAEMARLAVNGLTGPTDPEADYEIYWRAAFNTNPPVVWHSESDCVQVKFMEALPMMRLASGSSQDMQVEQRWMELLLQMQGPDGLLYFPKTGRPWAKFGAYGKEPPGDHTTNPFILGRLLGTMALYYETTGDEKWKEAGSRVVDGLDKLLIHENDKARFPCHEFGTEGRYNPPEYPADATHNPATYLAWTLQGLANFGKHADCSKAIGLARKLFRHVVEDCNHFDEHGKFLREYPADQCREGHETEMIHFHGHTMVLLSVLDYGVAAGDQEAIDFARRGFEYAMAHGECRLGYFAEWLNSPRVHTLELCELAEMVALAVKLSAAGAGDYWDMADRWVRNLFYEGQLRPEHVQWMHWLGESTATTEIAPMELPPYHTAERAVERNVGAFGGWLSPNDWIPAGFPHNIGWKSPGIMHCCTGNSTRAIYYAWENILGYDAGKLRVNLLMNRASQWADIDSHIPYAGQVDVKIKQSLELSVRIPEWVEPDQAKCTVNGKTVKIKWDGRYANVGKVEADDIVTLNFPIEERAEWIYVEKRTYRILLRGNTCVAIDPPGTNCPLFQREHLRSNTARWKKAKRFVSDKVIDW